MEPLDLSPVIVWLTALGVVFNFGATIWAMFSGPSRRNATAIDEIGRRLEGFEHRLGLAEQRLDTAPDQKGLHELSLGLSELKGAIKVMEAKLGPVSAIAERLQELMLNGKGGASR